MRTTFRVIAAACALLLATPALGASEFDIANSEHDSNGGTNGAKRVTPVDGSGNSLVSGGLKSNIVDAAGDSAVDSTTNAVKTVNVDSTGAVLAGGGGSRVELIATGTHTTTTHTSTITVYDCVRPKWAHSIQFVWAIEALTAGGGGNLTMYAGYVDAQGNTLGALSINTIRAASAPAVGYGGIAVFGPAFTSAAAASGTAATALYGSPFVGPTTRFTRTIATADYTSWTLRYSCYGIGG